MSKNHDCSFCEGGKDEDGNLCTICDGVGFDTEAIEHPVCPHCGAENELEAEDMPQDGESADKVCRSCRKTYEVTAEWTVSFSTVKK